MTNEKAVSSIVGVVLLIAISMAAFSILYFNVLNIEWIHIDKRTPNVYATIGYSSVVVEHEGGNQVDEYSVFKNGVLFRNGSNWVIGDRINVPVVNGDNLLMLGDDEVLMVLDDIHLPVPIPGPPTTEVLNVNSWTKTLNSSTWYKVGNIPYLSSNDYPTNYIYATNSEGQKIGYFNFENTSLSGTSFAVNISFYCWDSDNAGKFGAFVNYTATGTSWSQIGGAGRMFGLHTTPSYESVDLGPLSLSKLNNLKIYFVSVVSAGKYVYIDHVKLGVRII